MGFEQVAPRFSVIDLFAPLDGRTFEGELAFQQAVIARFNEHLNEFPPHYSYRDAITWARRQGWLRVEGSSITIAFVIEPRLEPATLPLAA